MAPLAEMHRLRWTNEGHARVVIGFYCTVVRPWAEDACAMVEMTPLARLPGLTRGGRIRGGSEIWNGGGGGAGKEARSSDEIETQIHPRVGGAAADSTVSKKGREGSLICDRAKEASVLSDGSFPHTHSLLLHPRARSH